MYNAMCICSGGATEGRVITNIFRPAYSKVERGIWAGHVDSLHNPESSSSTSLRHSHRSSAGSPPRTESKSLADDAARQKRGENRDGCRGAFKHCAQKHATIRASSKPY